ncbi:unnamed protein product [Moneuplotes crassus]|uniref:Pyroglutamyl-peptidase I n=1 Tax=Euplotes crassus TaxID=5936 RepID=A0AAD1XXP1_EUPCR|nr:unnamed protein product [Moneuplotes crassus]
MENKTFNLYISGFGPFDTVTKNPTTTIVEELDIENEIRKDFEDYNINVVYKEVIEVDIDSVDEQLDCIHDKIQDSLYDGSYNLVLHLGTDSSSSRIQVEKQAANCKDFTIPDNQGNQPQGEKIDRSKDIEHCLASVIDTSTVVAALRAAEYNCVESKDAGKYICNYIYYSCMNMLSYTTSCDIVFIHVPSFTTIKEEKQLGCVYEFIRQWITSKE